MTIRAICVKTTDHGVYEDDAGDDHDHEVKNAIHDNSWADDDWCYNHDDGVNTT